MNLLDTDHPASKLEVIVSLDSAADGTGFEQLHEIDDRVRVIRSDGAPGKADALNAGVSTATGDIVVMADANQLFDTRTIPELVAALEDHRFGAVSGSLQLGGAGSPVHYYWALEKWIRHREAIVSSTIGVTGAVYAIRRSLWPRIPSGTLLDDVYVPLKVMMSGWRIGFVPAALAYDVRVFHAEGEAVRKARTSTGLFQLRHLLPEAFSIRANPQFAHLVWHKYLRLLTPLLAAVAGIAFLVALANIVRSMRAETIVVALAALALLTMVPPARRSLASAVRWGISLNASLVRATLNGLRNRWQVWQSR